MSQRDRPGQEHVEGLDLVRRRRAALRTRAALLLVLAGVAGLVYARTRAHLPPWGRDHGGGILYVLLLVSLGFLLFPRASQVAAVATAATLGTCVVEFLQLWDPPWLHALRRTTLGAATLGTTFSWADFPPYLVGGGLGYGILRLLTRTGSFHDGAQATTRRR